MMRTERHHAAATRCKCDGHVSGTGLRSWSIGVEWHQFLLTFCDEDDFVGAAEHALHAFEIHALPCHRRSLPVLLTDLEEARRLSRASAPQRAFKPPCPFLSRPPPLPRGMVSSFGGLRFGHRLSAVLLMRPFALGGSMRHILMQHSHWGLVATQRIVLTLIERSDLRGVVALIFDLD